MISSRISNITPFVLVAALAVVAVAVSPLDVDIDSSAAVNSADVISQSQATSANKDNSLEQYGPEIQRILRRYGGHPIGYLLRRLIASEPPNTDNTSK